MQSLRNLEKEIADLKSQIANATTKELSKNRTIASLEQGKLIFSALLVTDSLFYSRILYLDFILKYFQRQKK